MFRTIVPHGGLEPLGGIRVANKYCLERAMLRWS